MPLPPAIWSAFPGREIVSGVFDASGLDKSWQPLSIDPFAGWNSLFSMVVPAAALVLMAAGGEQVGGRLVKLLCIIRSDEHTYELQHLMRISFAVICLKKKKN